MSDKKKKIAVATGSRADWGLLLPLVKELKQRDCDTVILATYAHLFKELGNTIQEIVDDGFPPTASIPARMKATEAVADTVTGFSRAFRFMKPDSVVILGDRFEMLGVATAALLEKIPIAHIAGGTISEGAYDDAIRNAISQMAMMHFPETDKGRERLIKMGAKPVNIVTSGALGVYNALNTKLMPLDKLEESIGFKLGDRFLLGTFHPATLECKSPIEQMDIWLDGLRKVLEADKDLNVLLTYPNSDTDPGALLLAMYDFERENKERVRIVESLGRVRYLSAAAMATVVAGNSSSGIVEIPSLGTPVVDVGIRQKGRERSIDVVHAPLDSDEIAAAILKAASSKPSASAPNPYFKEGTPTIIADRLLEKTEDKSENCAEQKHPDNKGAKPFILIPARGGSKGVPGKNIRPICGRPLIEYTVKDALDVTDAENVIVSTDSVEIAEAARKAGANVPFMRPHELATDTAGSREVILHAAEFLQGQGKDFDSVVLLQPTSPLRDPEDIRKALDMYENSDADMVVSVNEAQTNPYYNGFEADADGYLKLSKGEGGIRRRQDAPKVWEFNGSIYVIRLDALRNAEISQLEKILPLPVAPETGIDIDTETDFIIAENAMKKFGKTI